MSHHSCPDPDTTGDIYQRYLLYSEKQYQRTRLCGHRTQYRVGLPERQYPTLDATPRLFLLGNVRQSRTQVCTAPRNLVVVLRSSVRELQNEHLVLRLLRHPVPALRLGLLWRQNRMCFHNIFAVGVDVAERTVVVRLQFRLVETAPVADGQGVALHGLDWTLDACQYEGSQCSNEVRMRSNTYPHTVRCISRGFTPSVLCVKCFLTCCADISAAVPCSVSQALEGIVDMCNACWLQRTACFFTIHCRLVRTEVPANRIKQGLPNGTSRGSFPIS